MLLATAAGNRGIAEEYEDTHVDPHFDAIEDQIQAEAERHWIDAGESLESMRNVQQVLLVTTPACSASDWPSSPGSRWCSPAAGGRPSRRPSATASRRCTTR
jgi:hypothetical protein